MSRFSTSQMRSQPITVSPGTLFRSAVTVSMIPVPSQLSSALWVMFVNTRTAMTFSPRDAATFQQYLVDKGVATGRYKEVDPGLVVVGTTAFATAVVDVLASLDAAAVGTSA